MADLIAVLAGLTLGVLISLLYVWRHRAEVKQGWRERHRRAPMAPAGERQPLSPGKRKLAIVLLVTVVLGNAFAATQVDETDFTLARIISSLVAVAGVAVVLRNGRSQRR